MGRNDDVLVLSNGEKLNPVDTEARINGSHPSVTGALVIGQGRFAAGLLLEVQGIDTSNPSEVSELLAEIWPTIDATNRDAPAHGHLSKDFILFTSADKPFSRTPKLSVRRKASIALYEEEINQMYEGYSKGVDNEADSSVRSIDVTSAAGIESFVLETLRSDAGMDLNGKVDDDFFALGMDSLQVMRLTRRIKTALAQKGVTKGMDARLLYNNPTVTCIAQAIMSHVNPTGHETTSNSDDAISKMIQEYGHFDNLSPQTKDTIDPVTRSVDNQSNVILTGSTGSLGCYILLTLLASPKVGQVYCINRAEDAKARQRSSMAQHDPSPSQRQRFEKNVHFLRSTSLGAQYLGLSAREEYQSLKQSNITHIIHNAWPVNFNHALSSFEPHIAGVKRLVEFCAAVPGQPKIIFVSSLSSASRLSSRITVPEGMFHDPSAPSAMGYGQSKYAAEHILNRATEASQGTIPSAILRVGQIAGPVQTPGIWPVQEWVPSLVISSRTVGALPSALGYMDQIDWVPIDLLAASIVELMSNQDFWNSNLNEKHLHSSKVLHITNPSTTPWAELLPSIQAQTGVDKILPLNEWIEAIRQGPDEDSTAHRNPAKKILPFYEALNVVDAKDLRHQRFELGKMARFSKTFERLTPVSGEWMTDWANRW
ncbi:hypothetical protein DOTSEDRAFT_75050 [Dothistroma septosporum NZE10]|uniref:Carrier domain-containing protein n=1 Tax=Dothistroma septosporum (strain NZE10 / CBS 128990) TaxID=675120 RepID=M2YJR1_DOTSN|nr:hypothetical protein DOTSEDRAFT_75050 [Dothistroma septosporum NZE10]